MTPEGKVKAAVKKRLKELGIWYYMPVQNGMGVVGIPDFICCWNGLFMAIETKAPGKVDTVTPNQEKRMHEIREADGWAVVVDSVEALNMFLRAAEVSARMTGRMTSTALFLTK
jgi:hypothetical protein